MRLIRDTEIDYKPFIGTLHSPDTKRKIKVNRAENKRSEKPVINPDKLKSVLDFEKELQNVNSVKGVTEGLNRFLIERLKINNTRLFFYDKKKCRFNPVGSDDNLHMISFIKQLNGENSIDWVFENSNGTVKPEVISYAINDKNTKLIIIPIKNKNQKKGILLITSTEDVISKEDSNLNLVLVLLNQALNKIELLLHKYRMKELTKELQEYQSKMQNDNRVLAVGEMGLGAIEGILNPMQVITSYADMLDEHGSDSNSEAVSIIKEQVGEISKVISGLIKFSNRDKNTSKVQPADVNQFIKEYQLMAASSLKNKNYELLLDLQKDIPMIISNRDYVFQLLTNVFTILLSGEYNDGGILVQTKADSNSVSVRFVCTSHIPALDSSGLSHDSDISLGIIRKLMQKHQGNLNAKSNPDSGSTLILNFPLQIKQK